MDHDPFFSWADCCEDDDEDGSDCWIRHDGITASSDLGIRYRIGSRNIWIPRSQIVSKTSESIQVTLWLKSQRPELFKK